MSYIIRIFVLLTVTSTLSLAQLDSEHLLEKSSNSILLNHATAFTIENAEKSNIKVVYKAIIKNRYASSLKTVRIYYDQFQTVVDGKVTISDLAGNEIERYKLKDFQDIGLGIGSTASDGRMKLMQPSFSKYPFIIEVEYEVDKTGSLHYPIWSPQDEEKLRVNEANFIVTDKSGSAFRYSKVNVPAVDIKKEDGQSTYSWTVADLPPYEYQRYNYNEEDYEPIVYTAPNLFEIEGHKGDMSSWQSFGMWAHDLNQGRDDLNTEQLIELDKLITEASTDVEKAEIVYNYLQESTRYVSIQLGIGGWQPFSSSYVHEKKYGDCKALSFYTQSLLQKYGINSYYTLIRAGRNAADMKADFPNSHFNHAILSVPIDQDTIFLECTSQTTPFGYLGTFTSDRNALLITDEGGKLIRTKKYTSAESVQQTKVAVSLSKDGSGEVSFARQFTGLEIDNDNFQHLYFEASAEKRKKWFVDKHNLGYFDLTSFELTPLEEGVIPVAGFEATLIGKKEAQSMGKRLFIRPDRYITNYVSKLPEEERNKPVHVRYGFTQIDSITYKMPDLYRIESASGESSIDTKFGTYSRKIIQTEDNTIIFQRRFELKSGDYSPDEYEHFREFVNNVVKHDRERLVLVNKT